MSRINNIIKTLKNMNKPSETFLYFIYIPCPFLNAFVKIYFEGKRRQMLKKDSHLFCKHNFRYFVLELHLTNHTKLAAFHDKEDIFFSATSKIFFGNIKDFFRRHQRKMTISTLPVTDTRNWLIIIETSRLGPWKNQST